MKLVALFIVLIFVLAVFHRQSAVAEIEIDIIQPRLNCLCVAVGWYCQPCQDAIRRDDYEFCCAQCHNVTPQNVQQNRFMDERMDDTLLRIAN